jgi:methionyl aminopeptidase
VSTKSNSEFEKTRAIGHIVAETLRAVREGVRPGVATGELNQIGKRILAENGAAPPLLYGYPAEVSISINDEAMHGMRGERPIEAGDSGQTGCGKGWLLRRRSHLGFGAAGIRV